MRQLWHPRTRVLIVEDEPYLADAIRAGLRLEAIAADIAGDGATALKLCRAWWSLLHPWIVRRVGVHGRATVIDGFGAQLVVPGFVAVDLA
jgi:CheY-like chemotaxis protein